MNGQVLKNDLNFFSQHCLKIKTKDEGLKPFVFNPIQMKIDFEINKLKNLGKQVKMVGLKSRQVGFSTYTEARLFHNLYFNLGKNAFVMAEKRTSTENIFAMARRYYDNLPLQLPKPKLNIDRSDMIAFETDSSFRVGTAGSKSVGRSMTINYLHGSEVAYWENADDIIASLFQTVPVSKDSEIILESTANGVTGQGAFFYNICMEGLNPKSDWKTLFYPWYQHPEYMAELTADFVLSDEEMELKNLYELKDEQILWRRLKILSEFKGREHLFCQEYPASIQEAFIRSNNSLIGLEYLDRARKNVITDGNAPVIIGVDPARTGDRTVIIVRQGRVLLKMYEFDLMDEMKLAGAIVRLLNHYNANRVFIDYGHGTGTYDRLCEQGLGSRIELVNFGEKAYDPNKYRNRRAEMYDRLRDWFMQEYGVFIKDQENIEQLYADLMLIPDLQVMDSNGKLGLERKENIVKGSGINSTDYSDALALTFASFVVYNDSEKYIPRIMQVKTKRSWER